MHPQAGQDTNHGSDVMRGADLMSPDLCHTTGERWCPTWQTEPGQRAGRDKGSWLLPRWRTSVPALAAPQPPPPSRDCYEPGAVFLVFRPQGHVTHCQGRQRRAGKDGRDRDVCPPGNSDAQEKNTSSRDGVWGVHSPSTPWQPPKTSFYHSHPLAVSCTVGTQTHWGAPRVGA